MDDAPRRRRDPDATRARILDAAKAAFADVGYAGARVDAIAAAAGVNKRMLYHYFGGKRGLYREVYRRQVLAHGEVTGEMPPDPVAALPYWYDEISRDAEWTRLLGWEALTEQSQGSIGAEELRRNYGGAVGWIRDAQSSGLLDPTLDAELYLLLTIAMNMFPAAMPQVTRSVTGSDPDDPLFHDRWRAFISSVAERLRPPAKESDRPGPTLRDS